MNEAFRPTPRVRLVDNPVDDKDGSLAGLRGTALRELEAMRRENVFDLPVYGRSLRLESGETIVCRRVGSLDSVEIHAPVVSEQQSLRQGVLPGPGERDGYFYAIPGCLARYEGLSSLVNAIPGGPLAGWSMGLGNEVAVVSAARAGLPEPTGLPAAGIDREVGVFMLPGGPASGLLFGRDHIPDGAPFSVSCLVRLREPLAYDYTYDAKNLLNPFRAYLLQSADGADFTWDCPGSIAPLLGFCSPRLHPDWTETVTYPWAPWNQDFGSKTELLSGVRRVDTACPDAPLLAGGAYCDATGNAYPHPYGFVLGLQAAGLFLYNGNRLLGARLSRFETQFGYAPALSGPLECGVWHHAVMTHAADATVRLYLAREDRAEGEAFAGVQPLCSLDAACAWQASGVNAWTLQNGRTGEAIGGFRMNPVMDVALPRFFDYALSPGQAYLLQLEALDGLFVADDHEAAQGVGAGLTPVFIEKEAS